MTEDASTEPTPTEPEATRPASDKEGLQEDPGSAKKHGDPLTDIDDEMASGGGGND